MYSGLPKEHVDLVIQLEQMERFLTQPDSLFPPATVAKALTCLAHDYAQVGLEERCHALLLKADKIFPGYHGLQMKQDMAEDPEFAKLVQSFAAELLLIALSTVRDNK